MENNFYRVLLEDNTKIDFDMRGVGHGNLLSNIINKIVSKYSLRAFIKKDTYTIKVLKSEVDKEDNFIWVFAYTYTFDLEYQFITKDMFLILIDKQLNKVPSEFRKIVKNSINYKLSSRTINTYEEEYSFYKQEINSFLENLEMYSGYPKYS